MGAITNHHKLVSSNNTNLLSRSFRSQKSKIRTSAGLVPSRGSGEECVLAFSSFQRPPVRLGLQPLPQGTLPSCLSQHIFSNSDLPPPPTQGSYDDPGPPGEARTLSHLKILNHVYQVPFTMQGDVVTGSGEQNIDISGEPLFYLPRDIMQTSTQALAEIPAQLIMHRLTDLSCNVCEVWPWFTLLFCALSSLSSPERLR